MAITRANKVARTNSSANPATQSVTVGATDKVIVVLLIVSDSINPTRAGGAPTFGGVTMTQANSAQQAAAAPEGSAEVWYVLNPLPGTYTLSIPNTNASSIFFTVEAGQPKAGGRVAFEGANGGNGTSTNPSAGAITVSESGEVVWSITFSGANTWAPSAQSGTIIANTDDGLAGSGEQFSSNPAVGSFTSSWTFATSDDWGAVCVAFKEVAPIVNNGMMAADGATGMGFTEKAGFR